MVLLIREAIIEADFICEQLTILWPLNLPPVVVAKTLTLMWGEDEIEVLYPTQDMEVDYEVDDDMEDVQDHDTVFD